MAIEARSGDNAPPRHPGCARLRKIIFVTLIILGAVYFNRAEAIRLVIFYGPSFLRKFAIHCAEQDSDTLPKIILAVISRAQVDRIDFSHQKLVRSFDGELSGFLERHISRLCFERQYKWPPVPWIKGASSNAIRILVYYNNRNNGLFDWNRKKINEWYFWEGWVRGELIGKIDGRDSVTIEDIDYAGFTNTDLENFLPILSRCALDTPKFRIEALERIVTMIRSMTCDSSICDELRLICKELELSASFLPPSQEPKKTVLLAIRSELWQLATIGSGRSAASPLDRTD